ncbi:hypothetical protein [Desulfobacterium sp. N47]|uniref:Uncharacterized protein n=1 Tax=uncultured Desulfobacterium sp. TaxID=201089 RepID=E1YLU6_9BACT|nr:hypothetical protein N47_E45910 [uncultured Desulfobacterium sp.]
MLTYTSWVDEKIKIARAIGSGCCGGGYDEGALILCASISAMAALSWPGDRIDKKRFVEILAQVVAGTANPNPLKISTPLLCQEDQYFKSILLPSNISFYQTEEIDKDYSELIDCLSLKGIAIDNAQQKTIKKYSYGFLLYNQVRCGFAHEYMIGQNATSFDALRNIGKVNANAVSYTNSIDINNSTRKRIHFPISWISQLAKNVAQWLDEQRLKQGMQIFEKLNIAQPSNWWMP